MERDNSISHGASRFTRERLFEVSDPFQVTICQKCGNMTSTKTACQVCKGSDVRNVSIPYASKLLSSELEGLGLKILFEAEK